MSDVLTREQWRIRFVAYMTKHSDIIDWQADEIADAAFDMMVDETPEESAETELSYMAQDAET